MVTNAKQILEYLEVPIQYSDAISGLVQEIESGRTSLPPPTTEQWMRLGARRALGSNSLQFGVGLERWHRANHWMGTQLRDQENLSWSGVCRLNEILVEEGGLMRDSPVYSGGMEYLPVSDLKEGCAIIKRICLDTELSSFEKAFAIYLATVTVHPFANGNGRTARLASDWVLMAAGFLPLTFDSPTQSHVAVTLGQPLREKNQSFQKFLRAILSSYRILSTG